MIHRNIDFKSEDFNIGCRDKVNGDRCITLHIRFYHMSVFSSTFHFLLKCLRILYTILFIFEGQEHPPYAQNWQAQRLLNWLMTLTKEQRIINTKHWFLKWILYELMTYNATCSHAMPLSGQYFRINKQTHVLNHLFQSTRLIFIYINNQGQVVLYSWVKNCCRYVEEVDIFVLSKLAVICPMVWCLMYFFLYTIVNDEISFKTHILTKFLCKQVL